MKKLLCILLALAMCLSLLSVGVLAEAEDADAPGQVRTQEEEPEKSGEGVGDPSEVIPATGAEGGEDIQEEPGEDIDEEDLNDLVASVEIQDVTHLVTDTFSNRWVDVDENGEEVITGPYEFTNVEPETIHVFMQDGREFVGDPFDIAELLAETYDFDFAVYWEDIEGWTVGETLAVGDYTVTYRVGNQFPEYTVHIIDDPIESMSIGSITRFTTQLADDTWWYDEETGQEIDVGEPWHIMSWPSDAEFTITTKDGETFTGRLYEVLDRLEDKYGVGFNVGREEDQTPDNRWGVGEHTAVFHVGGASAEYIVNVIEDPIESITVEPITRLETDLDWEFTTYYDPQLDMDIDVGEPWRIDCWPRQATVTVAFTDGTSLTCPCDELWGKLAEKLGFEVDISWDSDETPDDRWGAGEYTAVLRVGGASAEYIVNVIEDPIESLEVAPITRLDTDLSGWTEYYDEETDEWVDPGFEWRIECWPDQVTVTMKDGETLAGDPIELQDALTEKYGMDLYFGWNSDETFDERWDVGEHTAVLHLGGASCEYTVIVVENPVESVSVPDFSRPVTALSDWTAYYDEEIGEWVDPGFEWRVDCWPWADGITVTMKDGKVFTGRPADVWEQVNDEYGFGADMYWYSDEPFTGEVWGPGEYQVTFWFAGVPAEYTVTVIENPVASVEVDPITRYEDDRILGSWYVDGEETGPYHLLNLMPDNITVTMTDGKTFTGTPEDVWEQIHDDYGCYLWIGFSTVSGEVPDESWGPGEYKALFIIEDMSTEYDVTVIEAPIESVEIAPVTVSVDDRIDRGGYFDTEKGEFIFVDWRSIDCYPSEITVTLKDGDSFTCGLDELEEKLYEHVPDYSAEIYWDSSETPENLWDVGEHEAILVINGTEYPYTVNVTGPKPAPTLVMDEDGKGAVIEGDAEGLYVRIALVIQLSGNRSGLYVTQGVINKDNSIMVPAFYVPGLTVIGVNIALVNTIEDISSPTPKPVATATFFY